MFYLHGSSSISCIATNISSLTSLTLMYDTTTLGGCLKNGVQIDRILPNALSGLFVEEISQTQCNNFTSSALFFSLDVTVTDSNNIRHFYCKASSSQPDLLSTNLTIGSFKSKFLTTVTFTYFFKDLSRYNKSTVKTT